MRRYEAKLKRYILRLSNVSPETADDILQEVFIKTYTNLQSFDPYLSFNSWVYRITRNEVISHYRKQKRRPQGHTIDIEQRILENIRSELNVESEIDVSLQADQVAEVINTLPDKYREAMILRFLEEKSYKEISDILRKPVGTVSTLLNRAKKKCLENIEQSYEKAK